MLVYSAKIETLVHGILGLEREFVADRIMTPSMFTS